MWMSLAAGAGLSMRNSDGRPGHALARLRFEQQGATLRILVTGASGFIGRAVAEALLRQGHEVVCAARRPPSLGQREGVCAPLPVDFAKVPPVEWWLPRLAQVDAIVNAVGILREEDGQTFRDLHTEAPIALFKAGAMAGVKVVVQVSALGADAQAQSRYHLSKRAADDGLRALPLRAAVVQPSLVYGPGGASTGLFHRMAAAPMLALPRGGSMQVQPVHLDDVVDGVLALLRAPPAHQSTIAFVGVNALALRDYLSQLRALLGIGGRLRVLVMPESLFRGLAAIAGRVPASALDSDTAGMLLRGNTAPSEPFAHLLGRAPREVASFVEPPQAKAWRSEAVVGVWLPVLRISIALLWLWTGVVSFGLYPVEDSLDLLARVGLHGTAATFALYGAAGLDLLLGILTLAAPARWRGAVWASQLLLIAGYTVLISLFLPEYWLHPYGPISKNLPLMAAIGLAWALEPAKEAR
jgi:uncharacterized protein YbjT (DUF2867 family)